MAVLEDVQTQEGSIFPMGMHWQSRERVSISVWKKGVKNCCFSFLLASIHGVSPVQIQQKVR